MFNKSKNEKQNEINEMMTELVGMLIDDGINGNCEISIKSGEKGKGLATSLKGNTMTIVIALVATLKEVVKEGVNSDEDGLEVVRCLWHSIGSRRENISNE